LNSSGGSLVRSKFGTLLKVTDSTITTTTTTTAPAQSLPRTPTEDEAPLFSQLNCHYRRPSSVTSLCPRESIFLPPLAHGQPPSFIRATILLSKYYRFTRHLSSVEEFLFDFFALRAHRYKLHVSCVYYHHDGWASPFRQRFDSDAKCLGFHGCQQRTSS